MLQASVLYVATGLQTLRNSLEILPFDSRPRPPQRCGAEMVRLVGEINPKPFSSFTPASPPCINACVQTSKYQSYVIHIDSQTEVPHHGELYQDWCQ